MKKRILSVVFALCMCISSPSAAHAWQEDSLRQEAVPAEEFTFGAVTRDSESLSPAGVYASMIALKEQDAYAEGTIWTNDEPYSGSNPYRWKGGPLGGTNVSAVGCVAFAFILSDAAFGSLPARMYAEGEFAFEDIKVGDILRTNNDVHTVIVLEVNDAGVVVAEGNISMGDHQGRVHWGRAISKEEVMQNASHYITRYPEGYVPPDDPGANESIASGTLDGGLAWNLTRAGTMTVSGKGAMPDFESAGQQPWSEKGGQIRKVVIGDGVTSIGSCAFFNCGVLSVEISPSVTEIGNNAFYGSSIISVTIPPGVKRIGDSAFRECQSLNLVTVFEGLETIGQNAFRSCTSLASIDLPASIAEVGAAAFFQCHGMTSATFAPGSRQVKMGDNMFTQCYNLMGVTLPQNIDRISDEMFQNCLMLPGVEIPQGAESIGMSAFASCSGFSVVLIPDSVTTIGMAAFSACPLKDIYFTGSEAQWNSIGKSGDIIPVLSKATMHYNYVPPVNPDPGDGDNPGGDNNPGGGDNPGGDNNPGGGNNPGDSNSPGGGNNPGDSNSPGGGNNPGNGESQTPLAVGKTFTIGKVTYKVTKAGEEVELKTLKSAAAKIVIDTVTGTDGVKYKVTSIGAKAMQNNKKMTNLTIGANVKKIGKSAFNGCRKLGKVTIRSTKLTSVGKQAFKGTKSSLKVKAPSSQLKKYKRLLKKAGLNAKQITK